MMSNKHVVLELVHFVRCLISLLGEPTEALEVNWYYNNFHLICSVVKLIYRFYLIESPGTENFALTY